MKSIRQLVCGPARTVLVLALLFWLLVPGGLGAQSRSVSHNGSAAIDKPVDCRTLLTVLKEQQRRNQRDFRRLQRELVALKQQLSEPGINEILGGIGYILGLFGVAFYVSARRREKSERQGG